MAEVNDLNTIGGIALFQGLSREHLAQLSALLRRKTFPAGATFITAEQPGEAVYVIVAGAVKVYIDDADGNEVIFAILVAGEVVGEMSLLDCASRSANAVTLEETTVYWMDRASFQRCLNSMPAIQRNLTRLLCERLRMANARIQSLALQDVEGRVAHQLLVLAENYGRANANGEVLIPFRLTQSDLASLVGATRVRVNQVIAAYKQRGYISVDQQYWITIRNQDVLSKRAHRPLRNPDGQARAGDHKVEPQLFEAGVPDLTASVSPSRYVIEPCQGIILPHQS
ncbi:MAG: Crp/Fnr family transcriptional regulator [Blastocatellia bacterium]